MWLSNRPVLTKWYGGSVEPASVLYDLDGPAIFISHAGPASFLFLKVAEHEETDDYLVTPIDENELSALKQGSLSLHGAMSHREGWLAEVDLEYNVIRFQEQSYTDFEGVLPKRGVGLYARFGEVSDTLEQAEAFISFKFESDLMSSQSMPLSVLKNRLDDVAALVKSALTPHRLKYGRRARFFDPEVAPLRFDSLLIAIKEPQFDEVGLLSSRETATFTAESLTADSEDRGASFVSELEETTQLARANSLSRAEADKHFELLDKLVAIVPTTKNELTRLQVGFRTPGGTKLVSIDKRTGDRLVAARQSIEVPIRIIEGVIVEVNDDAQTFIIKDIIERQATINLKSEQYKSMEAGGLLSIGQKVRVTGKFWERTRRDYMVLTADPIPIP